MSWYPKSPFHSLVPVHITQALTAGTCFSRLWLWAGWHILFCRPTQNFCHCDVTVSFPFNVTLHFITNLTQFPSVWCYRAALINLFQYDWQIIHHQALSVWCYRSSIINLCQCDVTDHPSCISVSVMDQTNTKASYNSKNKPENTRTFQFSFIPGVTLFTAVSWLRNVEGELFTSAFRDLWAILDPPQERRRKTETTITRMNP